MKNNKAKTLCVIAIILSIILNSIVFMPIETFAKQDYRIELFAQLADKTTSLYLKEAIVALDIIDEIYGDKTLLTYIEDELEQDIQTKTYLLERGFDSEKIAQILEFIKHSFPNVQAIGENKATDNIIEKLIKTILIDRNEKLDYQDYDQDIKILGTELYEIMPQQVKDHYSQYFETQQEKRDLMIKILVEFLYSGHGTAKYNDVTKEYISLDLAISQDFIQNVNSEFGVELLNNKDQRAINLILKSLEHTIEKKQLSRVYSDLSSVTNMVDANLENTLLDRAETTKFILKLIDIEIQEYDNEFIDVKKGSFYADYIGTAKSIGLINGYIDSTFRPNDKVTRSEMMSILSNTLEYIYGEIELEDGEAENIVKNFKYNENMSGWSKEPIAKLVKIGVIGDDYNENFGREQYVTGEEMINIIENMANLKKS